MSEFTQSMQSRIEQAEYFLRKIELALHALGSSPADEVSPKLKGALIPAVDSLSLQNTFIQPLISKPKRLSSDDAVVALGLALNTVSRITSSETMTEAQAQRIVAGHLGRFEAQTVFAVLKGIGLMIPTTPHFNESDPVLLPCETGFVFKLIANARAKRPDLSWNSMSEYLDCKNGAELSKEPECTVSPDEIPKAAAASTAEKLPAIRQPPPPANLPDLAGRGSHENVDEAPGAHDDLPVEVQRLAEDGRFDEIAASWGHSMVEAAATWVWYSSLECPVGPALFQLAKEGLRYLINI